MNYFIKFLWYNNTIFQQYNRLLFKYFIIWYKRLVSLFILNERLWFVIYWTTNYINTITLSWHNKITWISLKCIPYTSIIMLILWNDIGICKCLKFCLLISRVISRSSHMSTCKIKVFICTRFYKMIICWLKLWLYWWLVKKCWSTWSITMCNLFCNMLKNS